VVRNADLGILHSLYNQAPKKAILYEKQYILRLRRAKRKNKKARLRQFIPHLRGGGLLAIQG
jgi:hypothetical protein